MIANSEEFSAQSKLWHGFLKQNSMKFKGTNLDIYYASKVNWTYPSNGKGRLGPWTWCQKRRNTSSTTNRATTNPRIPGAVSSAQLEDMMSSLAILARSSSSWARTTSRSSRASASDVLEAASLMMQSCANYTLNDFAEKFQICSFIFHLICAKLIFPWLNISKIFRLNY